MEGDGIRESAEDGTFVWTEKAIDEKKKRIEGLI